MIPKVMIILGSASDKEIALKAIKILEKLQISYSIKVASAHYRNCRIGSSLTWCNSCIHS